MDALVSTDITMGILGLGDGGSWDVAMEQGAIAGLDEEEWHVDPGREHGGVCDEPVGARAAGRGGAAQLRMEGLDVSAAGRAEAE